MKRWQIFLLLLIVAFIPYASALFSGQNLGPTEHIQSMVTPDAPKPDYGWDILQADGVLQFLPWRDLVFDSWRHGEAPMLNPYQLAGQPLTANSQSGGFYPLHMLFAIIPGSTGFKIILLGILHLFIAGTGLFYLLRNLKVSESGSLLGATGFALSQFMVAWAPLASVPTTVAWIPWVLAGIVSADKKIGFLQVSLATAMLLLAGHLQFAFYGLFAAFLLAAWGIVKDRRATALLPIVAIGVGLIVAYPQVSLVLKNSQTSHRRNVPTEEGYEGYSKGVLAPFEALSLINPKFMGDPSVKEDEPMLVAGAKRPNLINYWSMLVKQGANPAECALWISPILLTLAFLGLGLRRKKDEDKPTVAPALILTILGFLLAFGSPLNRLLFFYFPGWSATGSAGRAHILIVLGICILAAAGFDRHEARNDGGKKWMALALVPLVLLGLGFNLTNSLGGVLSNENGAQLAEVIAAATRPHLTGIALSSLLASVVLLLIASKKLPKLALLPAALVAITLFAQRPLSGKPLEIPMPSIGAQDRTVFLSKDWDMVRTPKAKMPPNLASLVRTHDLFGYDSILDKAFVEKLKDAVAGDPAPPQNGNMMLARSRDGFTEKEFSAIAKLGVRMLGEPNKLGTEYDPRVITADRASTAEHFDPSLPNPRRAIIKYDGYDHQIIEVTPGTTDVVIKDRFYDGMTSPTPNTTVENEEGWRHIKTDGKQTSIRIDYPGRRNYIGVIIGITILLIGYIIILRKHEPDAVIA